MVGGHILPPPSPTSHAGTHIPPYFASLVKGKCARKDLRLVNDGNPTCSSAFFADSLSKKT